MIEFNPDGSLKITGRIAQEKEEQSEKMRRQQCIKIKRELVSFKPPKKCLLKITLSDAINDKRFIETIFNSYKDYAKTPMKIARISDKEFEIEVGTDFRRCTECNALINRYREFLYGNIIESKGNCTFEGRKNFSYEDYFD
jgi:hypothetical protein